MLGRSSLSARADATFALAGLLVVGAFVWLVPSYPNLVLPLLAITALTALVDMFGVVEREHRHVARSLSWIRTQVLPVLATEHHEAILLEAELLRRLVRSWRIGRHLRSLALSGTIAAGLFALRELDRTTVWLFVELALLAALVAQSIASQRDHAAVTRQSRTLADRLARAEPRRGWVP